MSGLTEMLAEQNRWSRSHVPVFAGVLAVHAAIGWALLSIDSVRDAVMDAVPVMIATMIEERAQPEPYVPPPPSSPQVRITLQSLVTVLEVPVEVPAYEAPVAVNLAPPAEVLQESEADKAIRMPAPSPPKTIPASAVEYIVTPKPAYPLYSRRAGETGIVLLRVLISEKGLPEHVEIEKSSGFGRLDEAALTAMRAARFKPYMENGKALAVWAPAPIVFEL